MNKVFADKVCVVTGAAGGIGRALAVGMAERGAAIAISDIHDGGLAETESMVKSAGGAVHTQFLDVADKAAIYAYADQVKAHFGTVHQVYNNAGISGGGKSITEMSDAKIEQIVDINLMGVLHGSRAFLPHLVESHDGKLINISSLNGLAAMPGIAAYCMTKYGVRGLTEAIRADALLLGQKIQVVCVHPGGIRTNIASANQSELSEMSEADRQHYERQFELYEKRFLTYPPEAAARDILNGVARGRHRIVVTGQAKQLDLLSRLLPELYLNVLNRKMKRFFS